MTDPDMKDNHPKNTEPEPQNKNNLKELTESLRLMSIVSNIGFTMVGCILTGFFIGLAIEKYVVHKTNAVYVVAGTILGVIAGFISIYKHILKKLIK
ncbi:AtpZ/AtpI family protein [Candidatus Dependentiae bacterium]|nr:AtpZ/AtpI family protein [Candidatus Dependentiae bacterium]